MDRLIRQIRQSDSGISMIWTAVTIFFFAAAASLAIDTSGAFGAAQTDQNTADLSCLAGVKELPDTNAAINVAVSYVDANWPGMVGASLSISGSTATYTGTGGNSVYIDADYGGSGDTMFIRTTEIADNAFGDVVGSHTTTVTQEAACSGGSVRNGIGMLPLGALAGSWNGDLFDCAAKVTGNCGALAPDGNGANAWRSAVANGITGNFLRHHGTETTPDPGNGGFIAIDCFADPCSISETEPGNMVGPWNQGMTTRMSNAGVVCNEAGWFNCDSINDVFGSGLAALSTKSQSDVPDWENSVHGPFAIAQAATNPNAQHYFYDGDQMNCDSPRLATVPIVHKDTDWDVPDSASNWPNGRKDMKFIGFYTIYIREPATIADLGGPAEADVVWFGPNAKCSSGEAFLPFGSTVAIDTGVKLVTP